MMIHCDQGSVEGFGASAEGFRGSAEGFGASAEGFGASAEGFGGAAEGFGASAEGFRGSAEGFGASAEGFGSSAEGFGGSAEGFGGSRGRQLHPLKPKMTHLVLLSCLLLSACLEVSSQASPSPSAELEGPRGEVSSAGPWLVRAYLPNTQGLGEGEGEGGSSRVSSAKLALRYVLRQELSAGVEGGGAEGGGAEGGGAEGGVEPALLVELTPSASPELWFVTLPTLTEGLSLRYQLVNAQGGALTASREVSYRAPASSGAFVEGRCALTLLDPTPGLTLSAAQDSAQPAGVQYTLSARYVQLSAPTLEGEALNTSTPLVKLTLDVGESSERSAVVSATRGLASFSNMTITPGLHELRLEGFGSEGTYCELSEVVRLNP